jgi:uncharacterized membrane protein
MIWIVILLVGISSAIGIAWASGIHEMHQTHPDYKDEEYLNWDRKNDGWDNKIK